MVPVVQNHYLTDSVICFMNTYLLDSDLSSELCFPLFEQSGPGIYIIPSLFLLVKLGKLVTSYKQNCSTCLYNTKLLYK